MQFDPIKPMLKAPGSKLLKLEYKKLLLNFAFNLNMRHDSQVKIFGPRTSPMVGLCRLTL